jgi:hypothetical protein
MTTAPIPICESCARLGPGPDGFGKTCAAFPDGIPDAIYIEGFDHRHPYPGDGGVRFEMSSEAGSVQRLAAFEASGTVHAV